MESTAGTSQLSGMVLRAVGIVKNRVKEPILRAGEKDIEMQGEMDDVKKKINAVYNAMSEIIIEKSCINLLDGIDDYSHLVVLYWAHKVPESSRLLTNVHPMGKKENPLMGVFSTCSPARPNPLLMTVVRLHKKDKNVLHVSGLDAIDGSPVLDIKPYVMEFYPREDIRIPEWMRRIQDEMN